MKTRFNINNIVRPPVKALKPYSSARDEFKEFNRDMMFLDANENPFNNGLNRYPDPQQSSLKEKLSEIKEIKCSQILLGNGSDEILDLIFRAFCEPTKDEVIVLPPTYGMYEVLANTNAVKVIEINLDETFQPNVKPILESQKENTKLLFLCSPNNPTANSFNAKNIEELIKGFNGIVVIDEAYIDFSNQESWLSKLEDFPNLIITQTLSKAYGLAGIRLGVCYASEAIISILNKIKPPYNVNALTQQKALERLLEINKVKQEVKILILEREVLIKALGDLKFIGKIYPSDANFILMKVDDANLRYRQLIAEGIVVRNRTNQPLCENCLRITVGTPDENKKLIKTLKYLDQ
ncbi:histidinol-phosphate transaminase [Gaetbulibacter sp. PBL-D1]|uniref:histidinol-phosphate transaminase n=1 Tax=Gaetbulibacter sp. PBL-D1 TaxID=3422594 RepID=UPI003D2F4323